MPGRPYDWNNEPLYKHFYNELGPSRHFTNVFNVFVMLQIFNMLNARKINDEVNIFKGITENYMFIVVWLLIVAGQVLIIFVGGYAFKVSLEPISGIHWAIALGFGVG